MRIVWIGAGNLATQAAMAMGRAGHETVQVFSRTKESALALAGKLGCEATADVAGIVTDADVYLFAVKDSALDGLAARIAPQVGDALCLHTAGSMPMDVFRGRARRYGVFYPMQTFSRQTPVDFRPVPVFIEASSTEAYAEVELLARSVSDSVARMDSEHRRHLHLAAVFACNFANHCFALSAEVLQKAGVPFDVMRPLLDETVRKVHLVAPVEAQTGPAVRYDENVMGRQIALLEDEPTMRTIYETMSRSIHELALKHATEQANKTS